MVKDIIKSFTCHCQTLQKTPAGAGHTSEWICSRLFLRPFTAKDNTQTESEVCIKRMIFLLPKNPPENELSRHRSPEQSWFASINNIFVGIRHDIYTAETYSTYTSDPHLVSKTLWTPRRHRSLSELSGKDLGVICIFAFNPFILCGQKKINETNFRFDNSSHGTHWQINEQSAITGFPPNVMAKSQSSARVSSHTSKKKKEKDIKCLRNPDYTASQPLYIVKVIYLWFYNRFTTLWSSSTYSIYNHVLSSTTWYQCCSREAGKKIRISFKNLFF